MENHCVHERTIGSNLLKNSNLSDSLRVHISDCVHCQKKYDLICHENSIIKEEVERYRASIDMKDHLTREVSLQLESYLEEVEKVAKFKKRYSFGSLKENILSFGKGLTDPVSLFIIFVIAAFYLIQI